MDTEKELDCNVRIYWINLNTMQQNHLNLAEHFLRGGLEKIAFHACLVNFPLVECQWSHIYVECGYRQAGSRAGGRWQAGLTDQYLAIKPSVIYTRSLCTDEVKWRPGGPHHKTSPGLLLLLRKAERGLAAGGLLSAARCQITQNIPPQQNSV